MLLASQLKQHHQYKVREYQYNRACEKLLRVKLDYKLTFDDHIVKMCEKGGRKIHD